MGNDAFVEICRELVCNYHNAHNRDHIYTSDVFVVWLCKVLQNNKALLSTTIADGMYYEITYNGDKDECYIDAYKKQENICLPIDISMKLG